VASTVRKADPVAVAVNSSTVVEVLVEVATAGDRIELAPDVDLRVYTGGTDGGAGTGDWFPIAANAVHRWNVAGPIYIMGNTASGTVRIRSSPGPPGLVRQAPSGGSGSFPDPGTNGLVARTALNTLAARTLTGPAAGLTVTNGDGVSGNPTLALADDLAAVEALSGTGIVRRTGANTWTVGALVTFAELGSLNDRRVIGRYDGSSGAPRELTPEEVRELLGEAAARVVEYTSSGTVSLPAGCTGNEECVFELWAAGGPGGGGARQAAGTQAGGGAGGGAGGYGVWRGTLSALVGLTLTLGARGSAGAGATSDGGNGAAGSTGSDSSLGTLLVVTAGSPGSGGTSSGNAVAGATGLPNALGTSTSGVAGGGGAGGAGNGTAGKTGFGRQGGGGGGGGGINTSNTVNNAAAGGSSPSGSAGGAAGVSAGDAGSGGDARGSGGGGGRGSTTGAGGNGGAGTRYGAGGGGGGGARNGANGGTGGLGANAEGRLTVLT
jgi:hypothetical protein